MKKKIIIILTLLLFFTGCGNLKNLPLRGNDSGLKREQQGINLSDGGTTTVLESVKSSWKEGKENRVTLSSNTRIIQNYVGEYIVFDGTKYSQVIIQDGDTEKYSLDRVGNDFRFRSLYQKKFNATLTNNNGEKQSVIIDNILKYRISSGEVDSIIKDSYGRRDYQQAISNIDLYFIAYSENSQRISELGLLLVEINLEKGDYEEARKRVSQLRKIENFPEDRIPDLFRADLRSYSGNITLTETYIKHANRNSRFADEIVNFLMSKNELTQLEAEFLTQESVRRKDTTLQEKVKSTNIMVTLGTGDNLKDHRIMAEGNFSQSDVTSLERGLGFYDQGRYGEAIFHLTRITDKRINSDIDYYIGNSYFLQDNYGPAIDVYSNYISSNTKTIKRGEALYNMGISHEKLGNKEAAEKIFIQVVQEYPGTAWARKANIGIMRLRNVAAF